MAALVGAYGVAASGGDEQPGQEEPLEQYNTDAHDLAKAARVMMDEGMRMDEALAQALEDMPPVQRARCSVLTASATDILWSDDADEHEVHREATRRHVAPKEPAMPKAEADKWREKTSSLLSKPSTSGAQGLSALRCGGPDSRLAALPGPPPPTQTPSAVPTPHPPLPLAEAKANAPAKQPRGRKRRSPPGE